VPVASTPRERGTRNGCPCESHAPFVSNRLLVSTFLLPSLLLCFFVGAYPTMNLFRSQILGRLLVAAGLELSERLPPRLAFVHMPYVGVGPVRSGQGYRAGGGREREQILFLAVRIRVPRSRQGPATLADAIGAVLAPATRWRSGARATQPSSTQMGLT